MTAFDYQYAALEQNVTFKFKCRQQGNLVDFLDTSKFPFDSHICQLALNLNIKPVGHPKSQERHHLPSNLKPKFSIINSLESEQYVNKLVMLPNDYNWITRDWILKRLNIMYKGKLPNNTNGRLLSQDDELDSSQLNINLYINRRREPQIFILILPLGMFTCLTFLVFLLPTDNTSEKTLLTFMNFICLLAFNIYLFKLVIYTYEFVHVPQILQYSNCLMIMQLIVFVYICLAKSIYQYGFFGSSSRTIKAIADEKIGKQEQVVRLNSYQLDPRMFVRSLNNRMTENIEMQDTISNRDECCTLRKQVNKNILQCLIIQKDSHLLKSS